MGACESRCDTFSTSYCRGGCWSYQDCVGCYANTGGHGSISGDDDPCTYSSERNYKCENNGGKIFVQIVLPIAAGIVLLLILLAVAKYRQWIKDVSIWRMANPVVPNAIVPGGGTAIKQVQCPFCRHCCQPPENAARIICPGCQQQFTVPDNYSLPINALLSGPNALPVFDARTGTTFSPVAQAHVPAPAYNPVMAGGGGGQYPGGGRVPAPIQMHDLAPAAGISVVTVPEKTFQSGAAAAPAAAAAPVGLSAVAVSVPDPRNAVPAAGAGADGWSPRSSAQPATSLVFLESNAAGEVAIEVRVRIPGHGTDLLYGMKVPKTWTYDQVIELITFRLREVPHQLNSSLYDDRSGQLIAQRSVTVGTHAAGGDVHRLRMEYAG